MIEALASDKGITRDLNQDALDFYKKDDGSAIYILCDGMGGYKGGEVASLMCVKMLKQAFIEYELKDIDSCKKWLYDTICLINSRIRVKSKKDKTIKNMGTTLICLIVSEKYKLYGCVGDSRLYSFTKKNLNQVSEDQTFAYALVKAGYISIKEASVHPKKNVLISVIGGSDDELHVQIEEVKGKRFLLCSDGLYNMLNKKEILKIINSSEDIHARVNNLINASNNNGGNDNISAILVEDRI